jgi:hypothetical protein
MVTMVGQRVQWLKIFSVNAFAQGLSRMTAFAKRLKV